MSRRSRMTVAVLLAVPSGLTVAACIGFLTVSYVAGSRRAPVDKARLDALEKASRQDPAKIAALVEERKRQTDASLERAARKAKLTDTLLVAAVVFLASAKWWLALVGRRPPALQAVMAHRTGAFRSARPGTPLELRAPLGQSHPVSSADEVDLSFIETSVASLGRGRDAVIPLLHAAQSHYRYLPQPALSRICELTEITPAQVTGVASFYRAFRSTPTGEHLLKVCHGTACHVAGAPTVGDELRRLLGVPPGADTDPLRRWTIQEVACLGCCTLAPVVQIDGRTCGHVSADHLLGLLQATLDRSRNGAARERVFAGCPPAGRAQPIGEIRIGLGSCCVAGGSGKVHEALERAVAEAGMPVTIKRVGCVGMCHRTPLVETILPGHPPAFYASVNAEDAPAIVRRHFPSRRLSSRLHRAAATVLDGFRRNGQTERLATKSIEVRDPPVSAFLGPQKHIATEHCGHLDPTDLDEYLRHDGFRALERCLKALSPSEIIEEIQRSGLRGRGGAGFPTGAKWSKVRAAPGTEKYVICNGDEGDPGAFMDRMLMESFPFRIIEGVVIAAFAVGAREGYFYIRAEYPLAVTRIREALHACEARGLLGASILGSGASLRLHIMEGAGAFVCGEETALIASLEGRRGSPRLRPPYPADSGLWDKPTLVGNVETFATVPWIMRNGADTFAALGTKGSKGTKVFALAGKIQRGGLIEVPMGVTIRQIVEEIGGGIKDGRRFKAVQIGGPSGGCMPASLADTPVDYEALSRVGAIMGSGGLVVLDETDCMVDIARYFLAFTQDQSCGKCTFCRIGSRRMLDILNRLCAGEGNGADLATLERLAEDVRSGSLCGLGKTAPNPVLTTLRYFRDEYEAHLEGRCPAGKCKPLIAYRVTDDCVGCTLCAQHCPAEAIAYRPYEPHEIDRAKCTRCDLCRLHCPEHAIEIVSVCDAPTPAPIDRPVRAANAGGAADRAAVRWR